MRAELSRAVTSLVFCFLFIGCGASEEKVQDDFEEFLSSRRDCSEDGDCVVRPFACPLGCYQVFNEEYEDEVEEEAERLIRKYERGGKACDYGCTEPPEPMCDAGECTME